MQQLIITINLLDRITYDNIGEMLKELIARDFTGDINRPNGGEGYPLPGPRGIGDWFVSYPPEEIGTD